MKEYENGTYYEHKKTKHLCVGGSKEDLTLNNNTTIEACEEYTYLGSTIETTVKQVEGIT